MHSIRFCRRCDTGPSSICADGIEELPTSSPHPGDIIMVCKMKMSDAEPFKTMIVMSASEASALRLGCRQPLGNVERRRLGDAILKNIKSYAPRCAQLGDISGKAKTYLEKWSLCTWPRLPRPSVYSFLNFRRRCKDPVFYNQTILYCFRQRARLLRHLGQEKDDCRNTLNALSHWLPGWILG